MAAPPEKINFKTKLQLLIELFCIWLNNLKFDEYKKNFLNLNTHFAAPWTLPLEAATSLVLNPSLPATPVV